ncbi:MAG: hypothetical protein ACD_62C00214G0001 [uncultured bacterium]|nr:MAG: hypothetical protein ACD_62C00214G0001 [uncultured bacterium]
MQKKSRYNVAIVGATGAVGSEFLNVLARRNFPIDKLKLLASARSAGQKIVFKNQKLTVEELTAKSFEEVDLALFSAGGDRSLEFAPIAVKAGAIVVDNSSVFRLDLNVPLVVPEVNPQDVHKHQGIIANPNCTTIILCVAVAPIHQINPIKRIVVSSYQAVSGAGALALAELKTQQKDILDGKTPQAKVLRHVIANNLFSHDSAMQENGYNQEELKLVYETRKIFHDDSIQISPTCVRVPIYRAHSEAINLQLSQNVDLTAIKSRLEAAPGLKLVDDATKNHYPMPLEASGQDAVLVGRLRKDLDRSDVLSLFVCGDQLLKGAALNAVQIAEIIIGN